MQNYVEFGMFWQEYAHQRIELPSDVDPNDREAVIKHIKSVWDHIGLPAGSYVGDSAELDEEYIQVVTVPNLEEYKNTRFDYSYRDGANYRYPNSVVVAGRITEEQKKIILDCLDFDEPYPWFMPEQVDLPLKRCAPECEQYDPEIDHDMCEVEDGLESFKPTNDEPTVSMTVTELVDKFRHAAGHWGEWV